MKMTLFIIGILTGAGFILTILAGYSGKTEDIILMALVTIALVSTGLWMIMKQRKRGKD
jgi:hypothetical protein